MCLKCRNAKCFVKSGHRFYYYYWIRILENMYFYGWVSLFFFFFCSSNGHTSVCTLRCEWTTHIISCAHFATETELAFSSPPVRLFLLPFAWIHLAGTHTLAMPLDPVLSVGIGKYFNQQIVVEQQWFSAKKHNAHFLNSTSINHLLIACVYARVRASASQASWALNKKKKPYSTVTRILE